MADVIIPYGGSDIYREMNLNFITRLWEQEEFSVVHGFHQAEPWCKAPAVAAALEHSAAKWIIITDADVWCENWDDFHHGVLASENNWGIPHKSINRLDRSSTERVLSGGPWGGALARPQYRSVAGGGTVMLKREMYDEVPLDPRFVGWGYEDECWGLALRTLFGEPYTGRDKMWHLWHPPAVPRTGRVSNPESRALRQRYHQAVYKPKLMRQILAEV